MKKIIKKVSIALVVLIVGNMFAKISMANGLPVQEVNLVSKGAYTNLLKYNGVEVLTSYIVHEEGGKEYPAYCLNKALPGAETGSYTGTITGKIEQTLLWKVLVNGYPYKTPAELGCENAVEAYVATKQAVYVINHGNDINLYEPMNDAGQRTLNALCNILNAAYQMGGSVLRPSIKPIAKDGKWQVYLEDSAYVCQEYQIESGGMLSSYDLNLEGSFPDGTKIVDQNNQEKTTFSANETFKILIPIINLRTSGSFTLGILAEMQTKPVLYAKAPNGSLQDYAITGYMMEIGEEQTEITYSANQTRMIILKREKGTEEPLAGAVFHLLDENKNIVYSNLTTKEDGKVVVENLLPGKYYLQEIEAPDKFQIYTGLLELNISLNEELTVIVNNSKEQVTEISNVTQLVLANYEHSVTNTETLEKVTLPKTGY